MQIFFKDRVMREKLVLKPATKTSKLFVINELFKKLLLSHQKRHISD